MHAIPLARRGYSVIAVDSNAELLRELRVVSGSLAIRTVEEDILAFRACVDRSVDVVLCMGDTLTHLSSPASITACFEDVASVLDASGVFVLSFRDYSEALVAERRFVPVRSDARRILTCFLEYSESYVTVHDLLQEREESGWNLRVSSYRKLRLSPAWVAAALETAGFSLSQDVGLGGMVAIHGAKKAHRLGAAACRPHQVGNINTKPSFSYA